MFSRVVLKKDWKCRASRANVQKQLGRVENHIFPLGTVGVTGWPIGRGYRALSPAEEQMVKSKLREYERKFPDKEINFLYRRLSLFSHSYVKQLSSTHKTK